jgi:hypothetical protein
MMPLRKGYSRKSVGHNIATLRHEGKSGKQSVAIALDVAKKARRQRKGK